MLSFLFMSFFAASSTFNDSSLLPKAESGDVCAQATIGSNYQRASGGVERDYDKALEWYIKAANTLCLDEKCKQCQQQTFAAIGSIYAAQTSPNDEAAAFTWYKKAAEAGNVSTYSIVAKYYFLGEVIEPDYEKAYYWMRRNAPQAKKGQEDKFLTRIKSYLSAAQIARIDKKIENEDSAKQEAFKAKLEQKRKNASPAGEKNANQQLSRLLRGGQKNHDIMEVKALIAQGALTTGYLPPEQLLFQAIEAGALEVVQLIVSSGIDVNYANDKGTTALHKSIQHENNEITKFLIAARADIEASNMFGDTPLFLASSKGNTAIVKALLDAGADVNYAAGSSFLKKHTKNGKVLASAAMHAGLDLGVGIHEVESQLNEAGADLDLPQDIKKKLEEMSTIQLDEKVMREWLESNVKFNHSQAERYLGKRPIVGAISQKHYDVAKTLIQSGAEVGPVLRKEIEAH